MSFRAPETLSTARPLRDWLEDPELLRLPETVIPHLAVEGRVSLLSGREKVGKSTLAAGAAAVATHGGEVLGIHLVAPIRTLWYALDEPIGDAVRRFSALGATHDGIVINVHPRTSCELMVALERDLETFDDVGVVVVDTFSRVLAVSGVDPNSSREVEPVLAKLVDLFHRQNIAGILLYHTGKGGKEYRGSTAIGATVDEILTLRKRGQSDEDDFLEDHSDDGRRLLVQDGRNLRGRVQLVFRDGTYRLYEEASAPRDRILETLRDYGTAAGRADLVKLSGLRKSAGLKAVGELIGSGAIIEVGRQLKMGSAQFPENGTSPEPPREPAEAGSHCRRGRSATEGTELEEPIL